MRASRSIAHLICHSAVRIYHVRLGESADAEGWWECGGCTLAHDTWQACGLMLMAGFGRVMMCVVGPPRRCSLLWDVGDIRSVARGVPCGAGVGVKSASGHVRSRIGCSMSARSYGFTRDATCVLSVSPVVCPVL